MAKTIGKDLARRSSLCQCGGDIFERGLNNSLAPVWRCENCGRETPRTRPHRKTNYHRAIEAAKAIREAWEPVDDALSRLVTAGKAQGGAFMVHGSSFNYHLNWLMDNPQPSNFEVRYHAERAKEDLAKAQAFTKEKE